MAESTPRFSIAYPSNQQQPFFTTFENGITEIDSLLFAGYDDRGTVTLGGGTMSWDGGGTNELSFTSDILFVSPTFGQVESLTTAVSPVTIAPGEFLTVELTRGATSAKGLDATLLVSSSPTIGSRRRILCWHNPSDNSLVFLTGLSIRAGSGSSGVLPGPVGNIFDSRGSGSSTGTVLAGGMGSVNVPIGMPKGTLSYLKVSADAATDGRIMVYSDVAKTKLIYEAPPSASPAHSFAPVTGFFVDRTPAYMLSDDGTDLESDTLYFSIENSGGTDANFTVEMIIVG
jgi:hypothetical protein